MIGRLAIFLRNYTHDTKFRELMILRKNFEKRDYVDNDTEQNYIDFLNRVTEKNISYRFLTFRYSLLYTIIKSFINVLTLIFLY